MACCLLFVGNISKPSVIWKKRTTLNLLNPAIIIWFSEDLYKILKFNKILLICIGHSVYPEKRLHSLKCKSGHLPGGHIFDRILAIFGNEIL